jgi:hypothetical protein
MDPDQITRMHRLVWIHAGRKRIMLFLSRPGSIMKMMNIEDKAVCGIVAN